MFDNTVTSTAAVLDIFPCLASSKTNTTVKATPSSIAAVILFLRHFIVSGGGLPICFYLFIGVSQFACMHVHGAVFPREARLRYARGGEMTAR